MLESYIYSLADAAFLLGLTVMSYLWSFRNLYFLNLTFFTAEIFLGNISDILGVRLLYINSTTNNLITMKLIRHTA